MRRTRPPTPPENSRIILGDRGAAEDAGQDVSVQLRERTGPVDGDPQARRRLFGQYPCLTRSTAPHTTFARFTMTSSGQISDSLIDNSKKRAGVVW